ncbi:MAG: anion permease [Candidatus Accumulibacter sp.]|jgi:sodium-dependent dicarboxylate transporter 2/3/5|nr:anion permease [Accumulibacter sp.]
MQGRNDGKESFFDFSGAQTGAVLARKNMAGILAALVFFALIELLPFADWGLSAKGQGALAILGFSVILWVTEAVPSVITSFLMGVLAVALKVMTLGELQASFGNSPFLIILCLLVVSMGMSNTTLAARISYYFILRIGTSPFKIIFCLMAAVTLISFVIADIPATALMAPIAFGILQEMGEEPGKSRLGQALMIGLYIGAGAGGLALINGSGINFVGLNVLSNLTKGAYTISYYQWAAVGVPFALLMIWPISACLYYGFGVQKDKDTVKVLDVELFRQKLSDLGPVSMPETRFIVTILIIMALFITSPLTGLGVPTISFIGLVIVAMPLFGTVNVRECMRKLPWDVLFLVGMATAFAAGIGSSGLAAWIAGKLSWATGYSLFWLLAVVAVAGTLAHLVIVASTSGCVAVLVVAVVSLASAAGVDPRLMVLAAVYVGSVSLLMPIEAGLLITKGYNYWQLMDVYKVGIPLSIVWAIVTVLVLYFVGPAAGLV